MAAVISEAVRGWTGCFCMEPEVTWGTAVTPPTLFLPYHSNTIQPSETIETAPYMAAASTGESAHVPLSGSDSLTAHDVGGDLTTTFRYDDEAIAFLLACLMGTAPTTSGSGPYVHTFLLAAAAGLFFTGQNVIGAHSSLNRGEVIPGCVVNSMELSWNARGRVTVKFGIIAYKSNGFAAISGTVAIADAQEMLGSHLGVLAWNSLSLQPKSGTLTIDRGLVRRPNAGNGAYTDKPQPGGVTTINLKVKMDWTAHDLEAARAAGTASDAVLTFTGASPDIAVFTLDAARVMSVSRDDGSGHIREIDVEWQGRYVDSSNRGFKAVITNGNADAY